jgi:hypothetical protein
MKNPFDTIVHITPSILMKILKDNDSLAYTCIKEQSYEYAICFYLFAGKFGGFNERSSHSFLLRELMQAKVT